MSASTFLVFSSVRAEALTSFEDQYSYLFSLMEKAHSEGGGVIRAGQTGDVQLSDRWVYIVHYFADVFWLLDANS